MLQPLRHGLFNWYWIGQTLSAVGDGIFFATLSILILQRRDNPADLGLVLGAQSLAFAVSVLAGGVVADRFKRSNVMAAADLIRLVAVAGFMLPLIQAHLGLLVLCGVLMGCGQALFAPAQRALIPALVPNEVIQPANALITTSSRTAGIVGPAIGGVVVTALSVEWAFAIDLATFAVSVVTLLVVSRNLSSDTRSRPSTSFVDETLAGVRVVWQHRWVLAIIVQGAFQVLLVHAPLVVLLPIYLSAHGSLSQLGYAYSAQAVGAVVGGVAASKIRVKEPGTAALLALLTAAAPILSMLNGCPLWVLLVAMGVAGIGGSVFGVIWVTAIQRAIPSEALARVASLDYLGQLGLDPVGLAATPFAVRRFGLEPMLVASGIGLIVTTILPFAVKGVRRFEDPRTDPEDAHTPPVRPQ